MGASPEWKVYDAAGNYEAACKHVETGAAIVALLGDGSTIRSGHSKRHTVWTEGKDGSAGESYDKVAEHVHGSMNPDPIIKGLCAVTDESGMVLYRDDERLGVLEYWTPDKQTRKHAESLNVPEGEFAGLTGTLFVYNLPLDSEDHKAGLVFYHLKS